MMILPQLLPAAGQVPAGGGDTAQPGATQHAGPAVSFATLVLQRAAIPSDGWDGTPTAPLILAVPMDRNEAGSGQLPCTAQSEVAAQGVTAGVRQDSGTLPSGYGRDIPLTELNTAAKAGIPVTPVRCEDARSLDTAAYARPAIEACDGTMPEPADLTRPPAARSLSLKLPQPVVAAGAVDSESISALAHSGVVISARVSPAPFGQPVVLEGRPAATLVPASMGAGAPPPLAGIAAGQDDVLVVARHPIIQHGLPASPITHQMAPDSVSTDAVPAAVPFIDGSIFGHAALALPVAPVPGLMMSVSIASSVMAGPKVDSASSGPADQPADITAVLSQPLRDMGTRSTIHTNAGESSAPTAPASAVAGTVPSVPRIPVEGAPDHAHLPLNASFPFEPAGPLILSAGRVSNPYAEPSRPAAMPSAAAPRGGRPAGASPQAMQRKAATETLPLNITAFLGSEGVQVTARVRGAGEAELERLAMRMLGQADLGLAGLVLNGRRIAPAGRR